MIDSLPQDPFILLSFINTRLRDQYPTLDDLCADMGIDRDELTARMQAVGFEYMPQINQFR